MKTFEKTKHIHFIGIGGISMSGIAELLLNLGYKVSGSDIKDSAASRRVTGLGGKVFIGHNVKDAEILFTGMRLHRVYLSDQYAFWRSMLYVFYFQPEGQYLLPEAVDVYMCIEQFFKPT